MRTNHDARFLMSSAAEIYYPIKYSMKFQNLVDNIAAYTLSSFTKKAAKEKRKDQSNWQKVYERISAIGYVGTEMLEIGSVMAVHYLLHDTSFLS